MSITKTSAAVAVFTNAIHSLRDTITTITDRADKWQDLDREKILMEEILNVYNLETSTNAVKIDTFNIHPFTISYREKDENEKPFQLILTSPLQLNHGEVTLLTGASGSGKSTFLKIATSRIRFDKKTNITPTNYMYYDDTVDFGAENLLSEIFCLTNPEDIIYPEDFKKMEEIMRGTKIFNELEEQSKNVWEYLKKHTGKDLSRGQKQRLIVSKILYWINDEIDIIALDECTSGLDAESTDDSNADAISIMKFIINFCNKDRKRILILSTHQDLDALGNHKLHFKRNDGKTIIQQVF